MQTNLLIADDHAILREGVISALSTEENTFHFLQAENLEGVIQTCNSHDIDILILDLNMPGMNGIGGIKKIVQAVPGLPIIILSAYNSDSIIKSCIQFGIMAYVIKSGKIDSLKTAINRVLKGETCFPAISSDPLSEVQFSPRQHEVLLLLSKGLSNQEIASQLYISEGTVKRHVHSILASLGAKNRTEAISISKLLGLIL